MGYIGKFSGALFQRFTALCPSGRPSIFALNHVCCRGSIEVATYVIWKDG